MHVLVGKLKWFSLIFISMDVFAFSSRSPINAWNGFYVCIVDDNINGLCGKLSKSVLVSLEKSFLNVGLFSWCFCWSLFGATSASSKLFNILHISDPHSSHRIKAELSKSLHPWCTCCFVRAVSPKPSWRILGLFFERKTFLLRTLCVSPPTESSRTNEQFPSVRNRIDRMRRTN